MTFYLPIAEIEINLLLILFFGFVVGFMSGLFGVGGSFTLSPPLHALPPRLRCPLIRDSPGAARSTATGTAESSAGAMSESSGSKFFCAMSDER